MTLSIRQFVYTTADQTLLAGIRLALPMIQVMVFFLCIARIRHGSAALQFCNIGQFAIDAVLTENINAGGCQTRAAVLQFCESGSTGVMRPGQEPPRGAFC